MLLLKGEQGKSVMVHELLKATESRCIVYYNQTLPFQSIFIDSDKADLVELRKCILEYMEKNLVNINWFIVYTNETEDDLSGFISWLESHKDEFNCRDIMITCK